MIGLVMSLLSPIYKTFITLLNARQVEYLLVGGYAVGIMATPGRHATWIFGLPHIR